MKEKLFIIIEDDAGSINTRTFRDINEAIRFIYGHFELLCKRTMNIDSIEDVDCVIDEENERIQFDLDGYHLWLDHCYLFNNNPIGNDGTKKFRGDTERSRQEDRTTSRDGGET